MEFSKTIGLGALLVILPMPWRTSAAAAAAKPNVVIIMTDDQLLSSLGFRGGDVLTPHIDALAAEGVYFSNAYASSSICAPARYSTLTGRYASRNRSRNFLASQTPGSMTLIDNENIDMELDSLNLQSVLRANGYVTGMVGKWHLGPHIGIRNSGPTWQEFGLTPYPPDADPRENSQVNSAMRRNHALIAADLERYGWSQAASVYNANLRELNNRFLNTHNIDWTVKGALDFIEKNKSNPFFLFFSTTLNHGPDPWNLDAAGRLINSVDADPRYTGEGYLDAPLDVLPTRSDIKARVAAAKKPYKSAYSTWLDDAVGALTRKLESLGLDSNTILIYMSDHGTERYGKSTLYEGGLKTPLIVTWKGKITPGLTCRSLVQNIDIAPTLFDLCGISPPKSYVKDGKSLRPLLPGALKGDVSATLHPSLFFEMGYGRAVRTLDYKYIAIRYPADIQDRINAGLKFDGYYEPGIGIDERKSLTYPYLQSNSHLGHYSSAQNPNYFELDQLYRISEDPAESDNLLYDAAHNPLPLARIPDAEKAKLAEMRRLLAGHLATLPGGPFGEFPGYLPANVKGTEIKGRNRSAASPSAFLASGKSVSREFGKSRKNPRLPSPQFSRP